MATLYLKRKFDAAHWLPRHPGKCSQVHGHTWIVEVWLTGPVDLQTGMVMDFATIKQEIDRLDHSSLNNTLPNPTAENLATYLLYRIPNATCVRVWETDSAYAEVTRPEPVPGADDVSG